MGERKGTNHYYPPDFNPKKGGLNKFLGTHPLRERARKLDEGILIIRFEMPFNIWCNGCGNHIGMGVRYNAEKKKVGSYYTTPIWSFRMKCHLCDNHFNIKTEPKTCEYIIVSGARRQENRWDPTENGQIVPNDKRISNQLSDDAMFKLEYGNLDKNKGKFAQSDIAKLQENRRSHWQDDYAANSVLRKQFRNNEKNEVKSDMNEEKQANKELKLLKCTYAKEKSRNTKAVRQNTTASIIKKGIKRKLHAESKSSASTRNLHDKQMQNPKNVTLVSNDYNSSNSDSSM